MVASLQTSLAERWGIAWTDVVLSWQEVDSCGTSTQSDRRRVFDAAPAQTDANSTRTSSSSGALAMRATNSAPTVADAHALAAPMHPGLLRARGRSLTAGEASCTDSLVTFAEATTGATASVTLERPLCIVAAPPSPPSPPEAPPPPSPPPPPPPALPPSPPSLPPFVVPMLVRGAALAAASAESLTVQWEPPSEGSVGTYALSRYVLHACEVADDHASTVVDTIDAANATLAPSLPCTSVAVEPTAVSATVALGPPAGRHFVLLVEAQSDAVWSAPDGGMKLVGFGKVLSSGNASVAGGAGQNGPAFVTHALPGRASAPVLAPPTAGLDNETSLHATWLPPSGNGLPLLWHELMVDVAPRVGAEGGAADGLGGDSLVAPVGVGGEERSEADDAVALAVAADVDAEVACDGAASVVCNDVADGRCYAEVACNDALTTLCGVGGHPLCRACAAGEACPPTGALRSAVALAGGGLRVRVDMGSSAQGGGPMQVLLRNLPSGSVHTFAVRAHNALGPGAFSAVATLRTAGEPPQLLLDDGAALSVTAIAGGGGGGLVGAAVLFFCIIVCYRCCKTLHHVQMTRRSERNKEESKRREREESEAEFLRRQSELQPKAARDQATLWALLDTPLSKSEVPGIDDADGIEVSRVLTHLAKEHVKFEREETQRLNAQKRKEARKQAELAGACEANPLAAGVLNPATKRERSRQGAVGRLHLQRVLQGKKNAGTGLTLDEEEERTMVGTYLSRCFGTEAYLRPTERENNTMARMLRKEELALALEVQPEQNDRNAVHEVPIRSRAPCPLPARPCSLIHCTPRTANPPRRRPSPTTLPRAHTTQVRDHLEAAKLPSPAEELSRRERQSGGSCSDDPLPGTWPDLAPSSNPPVVGSLGIKQKSCRGVSFEQRVSALSAQVADSSAEAGMWPDISGARADDQVRHGTSAGKTRCDGTKSKSARRLEKGEMDGFHEYTTCDREGPGRAFSRKSLNLDAEGNASHNGIRVKARRSSSASGLASALSAQKATQLCVLHVRQHRTHSAPRDTAGAGPGQ